MAKRMTTLVSKVRMKGRKNEETLEREGRLKWKSAHYHVGVSKKMNSWREVLRIVKPCKLFEDKVLKVGK